MYASVLVFKVSLLYKTSKLSWVFSAFCTIHHKHIKQFKDKTIVALLLFYFNNLFNHSVCLLLWNWQTVLTSEQQDTMILPTCVYKPWLPMTHGSSLYCLWTPFNKYYMICTFEDTLSQLFLFRILFYSSCIWLCNLRDFLNHVFLRRRSSGLSPTYSAIGGFVATRQFSIFSWSSDMFLDVLPGGNPRRNLEDMQSLHRKP